MHISTALQSAMQKTFDLCARSTEKRDERVDVESSDVGQDTDTGQKVKFPIFL